MPHCSWQSNALPISGREHLRRSLQDHCPHESSSSWENFTECFPVFCKEQGDQARGVFNTLSRHMESSLTVCSYSLLISSAHDSFRRQRTSSLTKSSSNSVSMIFTRLSWMRSLGNKRGWFGRMSGERTFILALPLGREPYHCLKRRGNVYLQSYKRCVC